LNLFRIIRNNLTVRADNKGERLDMRKLLLILAFTSFYIFVPFIYLNCSGQDLPYILGAQPSFSDEEKLEECLKLDVLISSCVDVLQDYEESLKSQENTVASVAQTLDSFEFCQGEETLSDTTLTVVKYQAQEEVVDEDVAATGDVETEGTEETTAADDVVQTEEETASATTCATIVTDMVTAYQVCVSLSETDKFDDCYDVEHVMESAQGLCDTGDELVSQEFCTSLSSN